MFVTAAVPKSSHYGFFGILKHKLGLSGRHKSRAGQLQVQYRCTEPVITVQLQEEVSLASSGSWENRVLESPQVRRMMMIVMMIRIAPRWSGSGARRASRTFLLHPSSSGGR